MTRTNQIVVWSGACAAFVAIYFYFHRPHADRVLPATQPSPSVFPPQRKEHSAPQAAQAARSAVVEEAPQAETVPVRAEIAAPQKDPLTDGLERILSSIQEVEMANKRTIHEGRFPAGETARMQIMQPLTGNLPPVCIVIIRPA